MLLSNILNSLRKVRPNVKVTIKLTSARKDSRKNLSTVQTITRNFHLNNILRNNSIHQSFVKNESDFVYRVLSKNPEISFNFTETSHEKILDEQSFTQFLNKDWRSSDASTIAAAFQVVQPFCKSNNIDVSDARFDALVDGVMDHCNKLTDSELLQLLVCLSKFPRCTAYTCKNFHDIWSCLDDICCWKMVSWDVDKMFEFADAWYNLNLGKLCDYIFDLLNRLENKANKLSKDKLVRLFFYYNVCRKRPVSFEVEYALQKKINEMNVDEMAVCALGYFKSQSNIKVPFIMQAMIEEVTRKSMGIHEITLSAIMKVLRLSRPGKYAKEINKMLKSLCPELERLSNLCSLHIVLLATGIQAYHPEVLRKCSKKLLEDLPNLRLKELERLLNVLTMFNFHPRTKPDIFEKIYEELHKDSRIAEINQHPKCLAATLNYFSLKGIYSYELMNRLLDNDFIELHFGRKPKYLPRELLCLNSSIDVECPEYQGTRLSPCYKYKAVKWHMDYSPYEQPWKKPVAADKMLVDAVEALTQIVDDRNKIYIQHVLPHFRRPDLILCKNKATNEFIEPFGFQRYVLGDVMVPFNDDGTLEWYAVMILCWNNTIRDTNILLGHGMMKERQLKKIGYQPIKVIWNEFLQLTPEEKIEYISNKLSSEKNEGT